MVGPVWTLLGLVASVVVGAILAVTATLALVAANAPDAQAAKELKSGNVSQPNSVVYGQR